VGFGLFGFFFVIFNSIKDGFKVLKFVFFSFVLIVLFFAGVLLILFLMLFYVFFPFLKSRHHIAYFRVHSLANSVYFSLSVLNILAISGTKGSSGLGSHRREQIDSSTFEIVSAGDHWDLRMSKQILPLELMFGW